MNLKRLKQKLMSDLDKGSVVFNNRTYIKTKELMNYHFRVNGLYISLGKKYHNYFRINIRPISINPAIDLLKSDNTTRRAVITFWYNYCVDSNMPPCYISVQFLIRKGKLYLIVNQRSMEINYLENDVTFFSLLAKEVCKRLKLDENKVIIDFNVASFHKNI